jgi:hypothetical protein
MAAKRALGLLDNKTDLLSELLSFRTRRELGILLQGPKVSELSELNAWTIFNMKNSNKGLILYEQE